MTPIEKNIFVVDEFGKEYEATYPKRAKGLVKNGRARFISESTICLACPPNQNLEEPIMTNNIKQDGGQPEEQKIKTLERILSELALIREESSYILGALDKINAIQTGTPGDIAGQAKAQGIVQLVQCHETTNQQLIRLYEKMYDDLIHSPVAKDEIFDFIKTGFDTFTQCEPPKST